MESMILVISIVVILILAVIALLLSASGGKKKKKVRRKSGGSSKNAIEIDPESLCNKIFKLAPSELKKAKANYIGRTVEIRTVLSSANRSKKGTEFREVVLDYQENRNYHVLGDINMGDYKDQSWMTREGKLKVVGTVKDITKQEIILDKMKIV